jgi:hypothetical protein
LSLVQEFLAKQVGAAVDDHNLWEKQQKQKQKEKKRQ